VLIYFQFDNLITATKMRYISILITLLFITSCGPHYRTFYNYENPGSYEGMMCVNQCLQSKVMCGQTCGSQKNQCVQNHQIYDAANLIAHSLDTRPKKYKVAPTSSSYQCNWEKDSCDENCESFYRQCYTNCGGRVHSETRCVSGCK